MVRWFLSRGFGLRYETAANTVAVDEYHQLEKILAGDIRLQVIPISERIIRGATRKRQGAVWRSFLCCLSMEGATKVGLGEDTLPALTPAHIFKKSPSIQGLEPPHQLVLNLVLTDTSNARTVASKGLGTFLKHLSGLGPEVRARVDRAQLIPPELIQATTDDEFVDLRTRELDKWLSSRLGHGLEPSGGQGSGE
jgi:hypothetical protein